MSTRTVTLELLRHGPSHNQLLSPLTPYLALCGNHDAKTVHVGFEHGELLRRMRGLRYQDGRAAQGAAVDEVSGEVTRLLAAIPTLTAEIGAALRGDERIIHLRLVLSAAELSLLPFELTRAPAGFPGQGQWLSLQTAAPIAITREVRRVAATTIRWPDQPRLLVVAAAPAGAARGAAPRPPAGAALGARSVAALGQRGGASRATSPCSRARRSSEVRDTCARERRGAPYTHVHVLAHGLERPSIRRRRRPATAWLCTPTATAIGDSRTRHAARALAAALRCHAGGPARRRARGPAVVTVASCDSGNVGSVIAPGASIAHELHEAGVPLVFASQFPLSMRGSASDGRGRLRAASSAAGIRASSSTICGRRSTSPARTRTTGRAWSCTRRCPPTSTRR